MGNRFKGKVTVVTGASKLTGIGAAIALKFASEGADVVIADLVRDMEQFPGYVQAGSRDELDRLKVKIEQMGRKAHAVELDVTDTDSVALLGSEIDEAFGRVDILVNNAGGSPGVSTVLAQEESAWLKTIDINLTGTFRVCRAVVPFMDKGGSVINMSSRAGKVPSAFMGAYCVAKAGVIMLTKVMALEFAGNGVRVNCLCPGQIDTDLGRWSWSLKAAAQGKKIEDYLEELAESLPLRRLGTPEDVANAAALLASDEAEYITGQSLNVTGGQLMEL